MNTKPETSFDKSLLNHFRNPKVFTPLRANDDVYLSEGVKFLADQCRCAEFINLIADKQHDLLLDEEAFMQDWLLWRVSGKQLVTCTRYYPTAMSGKALYKCEFEQDVPLSWVHVVLIWDSNEERKLIMLPWEARRWLANYLEDLLG